MSILDELEQPLGMIEAPRLMLSRIIEDPDQPRTEFDHEALTELASSIRERGVLLPILVQPPDHDGLHRIIDGARRFRASQLAGMKDIPVTMRIIRSGYDQMIANIQRDDLRPGEIAVWIADRLAAGEKQADIARTLGKSRGWVSTYSQYGEFPDELKAIADKSGINTAAELFRAFKEDPERTRWFLEANEDITQQQAFAFRKTLSALPPVHPSVPLSSDEGPAPYTDFEFETREPRSPPAPSLPEPIAPTSIPHARVKVDTGPAAPRSKRLPVVVEDCSGRRGYLLASPAEEGRCHIALVEGGEILVRLDELRLIQIDSV
ncbi:ParB/RepB/Spo0J family partition protein [Neorhizobium sp. T786]|uniref:ParB/RepB/Spo0J family partition protein n=1 Tax=Pseudorhizobium xiangyangii TaxID=2883104 RepID=UPI001D0007DE|nr:ParB/RepB/Spo0J family partition protein [Neorhizobium xiangyangii]MCB5205180.1 ParB/RepB/Spo0J family partition protein [Neorhizobium xiangyangii]